MDQNKRWSLEGTMVSKLLLIRQDLDFENDPDRANEMFSDILDEMSSEEKAALAKEVDSLILCIASGIGEMFNSLSPELKEELTAFSGKKTTHVVPNTLQ